MIQTRQIKFVVRITPAELSCVRPVQQAISAHHTAGLRLAHDHVFAKRFVDVAVDARFAAGQPRTHFLGKHLVAQALRLVHLAGIVRQRHRQRMGRTTGNRLVLLQHLIAPSLVRMRAE